MTTTVAQMTKDELREMIETTIEQKLLELLGDPDEWLLIRKSVGDRLLRQKQAVSAGERGDYPRIWKRRTAGGWAVEKIQARAVCRSQRMRSAWPATKPPAAATA